MSIIKNMPCKRMVCPVIGQENRKSVIHLLCQKSNGDKSVARIMDYEALNMVGDNVRKFRLEKNMSQQDLSERLETYAVYICRGSISRIEAHQRTVADYELKAIAEILQVSIEDMYE